jgi:hypothetical protein
MSSMPMVIDRPLAGSEWVEFDDFETAVASELARTHGAELGAGQVDADFAAMLVAQDMPMVTTREDEQVLRDLLAHAPPKRRKLPPPLPLDE